MKKTFMIALAILLLPFMGNACTMYKITKDGKTIVGNNEDYLSPNSQFWFEPGEVNKYSVMYMGQLDNFAQGAINEKGLMFDGFYAPYLAINNTQGKTKMSIGKAIREVMQSMSNVKEVKAYLNTIDLSSLTNSMLVFVDKSGSYLILEGDVMIVGKESEKSFSNFYYSQTKDVKNVNLKYFQNGQKYINSSKSEATFGFCSKVMGEFAQKNNVISTQYSTIYDLNTLTVRVYLFHDYTQFIEIDLMQEFKKGAHKTMIAELFPKESTGYKHYVKFNDTTNPTLFIEEIIAQHKYSQEDLAEMKLNEDINSIGYEWLKAKRNPAVAINVFQYGLRLFPNDADLYDSLGEAYLANNEWDNSIHSYTKSLELDPENENAKDKLQEVKHKKEQAQSIAFKELSRIVDQYATNTLQQGNINSLAISIYRNGNAYQQYYGDIDQNLKGKPNDNTLYEIASISKVFVGSLAAKAVLEQKIKLDDDIRMYLPPGYANLAFQGTPITIQDLLTHTLGLKNKTPKKLDKIFQKTRKGYYENRPYEYTMSDLLKELKTVKLDKKPGTFYDYSSVGPELMAYILEQVNHKSYKEQLQDFLDEVGLENTYLQEYENHKLHLISSFGEDGKRAPLNKNPLLGGAYGMISTLSDLAKFAQYQLKNENPLIKESRRLLFKEEQEGDDKGYLWDVGSGKKEGFYYGKTGTSNGVQSGILICPDSNYTMVILMNNMSEEALEDWGKLYNKIETELIVYPKINLVALLEPTFRTDFEAAAEAYKVEKNNNHYLSGSYLLNNFGYDLLSRNEIEKAIDVFELAVSQDEKNANLYDSLGEAYFIHKEYEKALLNYKKVLELNPKNENAQKMIDNISLL